jgi:hypothetical protein
LFLPIHIGHEIHDELVHCRENIKLFPIPIMPMIAFSLFIVVSNDSMTPVSVIETVLISVGPITISRRQLPDDHLNHGSTGKNLPIPIKKMRIIHVGYDTNELFILSSR